MCLTATCVLWPSLSPSPTTPVETTADWDDFLSWEGETVGSYYQNYLYYGSYPQSYVGDKQNTSLSQLLASSRLMPTGKTYTVGGTEWTEYKDPNSDGHIVAGTQHVASVGDKTYHDGSSVGAEGDIKFFKVEPIKWWVISGHPTLDEYFGKTFQLVSDLVLAGNEIYGGATNNSFNYETSDIRKFANGDFYEQALSDEKFTVKTNVKNNVFGDYQNSDSDSKGTPTVDNVFLPSYYEMKNTYVTSEYDYLYNTTCASPSDFAIANNCPVYTTASGGASTSYRDGTTSYHLRSAGYRKNISVQGTVYMYYSLTISESGNTSSVVLGKKPIGFRPCISIINNTHAVFEDGIEAYPGIYKASDGSFHITDFTGLQAMSDYSYYNGATFAGLTFYLDNDIDCTGKEFKCIKMFDGQFNGKNHNIVNLKPIQTDIRDTMLGVWEYDISAFICVLKDATLQNVNFLGNDLEGKIAAPICYAYGTISLTNIYREGKTNYEFYGSGLIYLLGYETDYSVSAIDTTATIGVCRIVTSFPVDSFAAALISDFGQKNCKINSVMIFGCYCISDYCIMLLGSGNTVNITASYLASEALPYYYYWSGWADATRSLWFAFGVNRNIQYDERIDNGLPFFKSQLIIGTNIDPMYEMDEYFADTDYWKLIPADFGYDPYL